jgi:hypothetical protein
MSVGIIDAQRVDLPQKGKLSSDDWSTVLATLVKRTGWGSQYAERGLNETIVFLEHDATCNVQLHSPPPAVDEGWHALLKHPEIYDRLCATLGSIVPHASYIDGEVSRETAIERTDRTRECMDRRGDARDPEFWAGVGQCVGGLCGTGGDGGSGG